MAARGRSNPLALAVLASLQERPMHPYEVAQTLRYRAKHESIKLNYGSLYNVVEGLERRLLIAARETVRQGKRPERTVYEITEAGRRELSDWLGEMLTEPAKEYPQFAAALSLIAALPPDEVLDQLRLRRHSLQTQIIAARAGLADGFGLDLPRLFVLEAEFALALQETELTFVDELIGELESGTLVGLDHWRTWFRDDGSMDAAAIEESARKLHASPAPGLSP